MVQVTFMGTGAAFSTRWRSNIALLVEEGDTKLVVECGPTILYQLDRAGAAPDQISHLFISHRHGDHILGLPMFLLMCSLGGVPRPLTILGSEDVVRAGKELTRLVYPEVDERLDEVTWIEMPPQSNYSVELGPSLKLSTLPMQHSEQVPVLGVRLDFETSRRSLVYTGDTSYAQELVAFAADCDLLIHEANYSEILDPDLDTDGKGHSTARQAGELAARANCDILALVHLSPNYAGREDAVRREAAQDFGGQILVPNDNTSIYL
jgi:ribonuclease Z